VDPLTDDGFDAIATAAQPWLPKSPAEALRQAALQALLAKRAGAKFGRDAYVAPDARVLTQRFVLGDKAWVASGAIIRGNVEIGAESSVNAYAHIAGTVKIGRGCRIAGLASIYGFNHGIERTDIPVMYQPITSTGVVLHDDVWVGANAVILDGVEIGAHCVVAAGAVVTKSFPAYKIIGGNPARVIRDRVPPPEPPAAAAVLPAAGPDHPMRVRDRLFATDPYADLSTRFPPDLQGWDSKHPIFRAAITEVRPKLIVEVGTWKGASAVHMAHICREMGLDAEIVCVDTWLGNWQHWSRKEGVGSREDLRLINGFPHLYFQFMSNVLSEKLDEIITPLPLTGVAGAKLFAHHALKPDLIYIDGDHEYESVLWDLRGWLAVLAPTGLLIGDDFSWPGVKRAVTEICESGHWRHEVRDNKFTMRRATPA
jgi:acetyltransferase-like isoleucine patch superfamily enzyme/predicted O-methyltransferase YrrM